MTEEKIRLIFNHCNLLDSALVNDRKKGFTNLLIQLKSPDVLNVIDENTELRRKKALTWDNIFKKVGLYVWKELDNAAHLEPLNVQKRQQEAIKFVRTLLKKADERGPRLKAEDVVHHFLSILKEPKYNANSYFHVGVEYCKLLKNILSVPVYQCDITLKTRQELTTTFVLFIEKKPSWLENEQSLLPNLIKLTIEGAANFYTVKGRRLFKFFENVFKEIKSDSSSHQVECLLDALNAFVKSSADDCRGQVCRLGESLFPILLQLWKRNPLVKNHLVQFMRLQICAHHPLGVHEDDEGGWSSSVNLWKKCLQRLYEAIVADIDQLKNKVLRGSSVKLDPGFTSHFIELAVDVLHQVFWAQTTYHSVDSDATAEPGAKRQKIELGWHVARDILENSSENLVLISWLQILAALFEKHPSSLPTNEFHSFFSILHQLQTTHKRHETILSLLRCIEALVQCFSKRKLKLDCQVVGLIKPILKQIWTSTLRVVGSKHFTDCGFSLLSTLLKEHFVPPNPELFSVILRGCTPSRASIEFLATYLQLYSLPEKFPAIPTLGLNDPNTGSLSLRHQLLNWLMPVDEESDGTNELLAFCAGKNASRLPDMQMVAGVLVALTQKFSTAIEITGMAAAMNKSQDTLPQDFDGMLAQMEQVYLNSTFDKGNYQWWSKSKMERKLSSEAKYNKKIESLCSLLCDRLSHIGSLLCRTLQVQYLGDVSKDRLVTAGGRMEVVIRFSSLVCEVMVYLLKSNSLTQEEVRNLPVIRKLGTLLKEVTSGLCEITVSHEMDIITRMEVCSAVISEMEKLFTVLSAEANSPEQFVSMLLREKTSSRFINDVLGIYSGEWILSSFSRLDITEKSFLSNATSRSFLNQTTSMMSLDEMDGFDDFESEVSSSESESTAIQRTQHGQTQKKSVKSVHSTLRESCARFLCSWSMYGDHACSAEPQPNEIQQKIVEFLSSGEFSISKEEDLKLYFTVAFALASGVNPLSSSQLEVLMDVLRQAMSKYRRDQKVCCQGLDLLRQLARHLGYQETPDESLQASRDVATHILNAFWTLKDAQYSPLVRLQLAKCMATFLKVDPDEKWCGMKQVKKNKARVLQESVSLSLCDEFPKLLSDSSHLLRMHMASAISVLFVRHISHASAVPAPREHQYRMFSEVSQILVRSVTDSVAPSLSVEESEDEGVNRSSSMLACLKQIVLISPICEKRTIALLFQAVKEQFLDKDLVKKVLEQLGKELGYSSRACYINSHLQFIIHNWLNNRFKITDFPFQLMDYKTIPDFFRDHHACILANLVSTPDTVHQSIELFTRQVNPGGDCSEFIKDSFCAITSFLLPWFAAQSRTDSNNSSGQMVQISQAKKSHDFLVSVLTQDVFDKILAKKFDEQIVSLLFRMYEPTSEGSDISQFTKDSDPEPDPPYFTSHAIIATFEYLTSCHTGGKTLVSVLCSNKDSIQKILLSLTSRIADTHLIHEKRRILSMYRLFVLLLLKYLSGGLGNTWAFFIRDVIYSLLRIISDETQVQQSRHVQHQVDLVMDQDLFLPCCNLIYYVCKAAVDCCSQEFGSHLHVITTTLTPYVLGEDERAEKALQLLNFLIVDSSNELQEAIGCLDPFPDTAKLRNVNKCYKQIRRDRLSLREEISHFLRADSSSSPVSRLEGLRLLRQSLKQNKQQLVDLAYRTEDAQSKPTSSPVADLVHELIKLCSVLMSCDGEQAKVVQCEVANCLGEIGAVDLATVSLGCRNKQDSLSLMSAKYAGDPRSQRNAAVVTLLNSYLVDKKVGVVTAAASCLKKILVTASGSDVLKKFEEAKQEQLLWYLEPFRPSKKKRSSGATAMETGCGAYNVLLEDTYLWLPGIDGQEYSHEQWLTRLACTLIESGFVKDEILVVLSPMCKTKLEFTEQVFPYLIHNMLECGDDVIRTTLSEQFRNFFSHCNGTSVVPSRASSPLPTEIQTSSTSGVKKESVRTMLAVVTYLRTQNVPKKGRGQSTLWDNNFWLDLDYLEVASAAQRCSAYFTALLYTEIWADIQKSKPESPVCISLPSNSQNVEIETALSQSSESCLSTSYQTLVLEAYGSIGEPDSMYGAGAGRLADIDSRVRTYMHEHAWDKALGACDLRMQNISASSQTGLLQSMKNFGLDHVMRIYLKGLSAENPQATAEVAELQYESAWRNCEWDLDLSASSDGPHGFHQSLYSCLCALQDEEWELFQCTLDNAKSRVMDDITHVSLESVRSVYPSLTQLQCIVELENFGSIINSTEDSMVDIWNERFPLPDNDFEFLEPLLAVRASMLQTLVKLRQNKSHNPEGVPRLAQAYKDLATHLEMQAKTARRSHNPQVAEKALFRIRQLQSDIAEIQSRLGGEDLGVTWSWKMEEAKLRWVRGEQDTAMYLLKSLTRHLEKAREQSLEATGLYPQALGLYGTWLAESKSENPNTIIESYLEKAACLMECMEEGDQASRIEAFLSLAWFADTQYQKKVDFMSSSIYENKESLMKKAKVESEKLQQMSESGGRDRYTRTLNLQAQMDEKELRQVAKDRRTFLKTAVEYYIKTLVAGDKYDMRVFRLCSLWFDNANEEFVSEMIKEGLMKIQSRKFLPLMYQLAARLGTRSHDNRLFQGTLNELIERTAVDHPHHTLFILFALANAEKDDKYLNAGKKNTASRLSRNNSKRGAKGFAEARIQTACTLIERIGKQKGQLKKHMELLCEAYIELAYVNVSHLKAERGPFNLPDVTIKRMSNLKEVPVPTLEVKVDPLCRYDDLVYVQGFDSKFCLAGGVNLPKIIFCVGSDGVKRRQLVKGRDDLRQDAVMEQVFGMVNQLLIKDSETRKRKLKMRTYKVIPLSQRSGIVEWCEDTVPLGEYLIGRPGTKTGAHLRYYPGDWTSLDCRKKIVLGDNNGTSRDEVYQELVEHFHPVFRHFFLERFPDPAVWFERRLSYTRGVATSSIVGYVVGLGDRHVQNILVDCNTAELVHIDLGVAFEQGKFLPTPETVPFRLTRDMVDGMGLTGVEGVYRRCCEKTMEVMRTSQESLMTVVEVLLYDPLSSWTLSPEKRKALQQKAEEDDLPSVSAVGDCLDSTVSAENQAVEDNVNKMAKRVLLRLKQKLDGVEDGVHLSVSGQVNHLIREAMDPKNLCRLFPGWQPWV